MRSVAIARSVSLTNNVTDRILLLHMIIVFMIIILLLPLLPATTVLMHAHSYNEVKMLS